MKKITIAWKKELKNSVQFFVYLNGQEIGLIKQGIQLQFDITDDPFELYFVPKAPRWFGWKALKIKGKPGNADASFIELSVQYSRNIRYLASSQLHINETKNMCIISEEQIKKY